MAERTTSRRRFMGMTAAPGCAALLPVPARARSGSRFREARTRKLPPFAKEHGATSWAQLFLKFILSHPAVTVVIPATSNPDHLEDDLGAGSGALLDEATRKELVAYVQG
jgi:aryl-alcohol dehydrogenase-like predicted oxidoreductase